METMVYGRATVEMLESRDTAEAASRTGRCTILEPDPSLPTRLVWVRCEVFSFVRLRGGWTFDLVGGAGGWVHADNVRNFVRIA